MISSIMIRKPYKLAMNSSRKIQIGDKVLSVDKEIPFIRYAFDSYGQSEYDYIKNSMEQFNKATHLIQIQLNEDTIRVYNEISEKIPNTAKYLYINISDEEVVAKSLNQNTLNLLSSLKECKFDRYMIKDNTICLDAVTGDVIIKQVASILGINKANIGFCSSPLSFGDGACLTAVKARELMCLYSTTSDVALPSANHQCMNSCGCIRYMEVTEDLVAPPETKKKGATKKEKSSDEKKAISKPKHVVTAGRFNF